MVHEVDLFGADHFFEFFERDELYFGDLFLLQFEFGDVEVHGQQVDIVDVVADVGAVVEYAPVADGEEIFGVCGVDGNSEFFGTFFYDGGRGVVAGNDVSRHGDVPHSRMRF